MNLMDVPLKIAVGDGTLYIFPNVQVLYYFLLNFALMLINFQVVSCKLVLLQSALHHYVLFD